MRNYLEDARFCALAEDAYRQARLRKYRAEVFATPDRMGMYALLFHEEQKAAAFCGHFLHRTGRLLASEMFSAGRLLPAEQYLTWITQRFQAHKAASMFLSFSCPSEDAQKMQEAVQLMSTITLYATRNHVPVVEAILLCEGEYKPLRRYFEEQSKISRAVSPDV